MIPVAEGSMETAAACEIARLPEELLSAAISRTSPRDACHAAAISPAFRAAADSNAVWSSFLPRDLPPLADGELSPAPLSKKGLFLLLSDRPLVLPDRLMSMWLDRETGAKCFMLSARALLIAWGDTPQYWRWIPLTTLGSQKVGIHPSAAEEFVTMRTWTRRVNAASKPKTSL